MTTPRNDSPETICIASSLMQKAVFLGSYHAACPHLLIGNRGISGDITYPKSVLNNFRFLEDLEVLLRRGPAHLFIPNALNSLYYFALCHPNVSRISYIDEGQLTRRFLVGGYRKPAAAYLRVYPILFSLARHLTKSLRISAYRVLCAIVKRTVGKRYERDTLNYRRRTIELGIKGGVVLSHIAPPEHLPWVTHVDLTRDVQVEQDSLGAACLFIHPNQLATPDHIDALVGKISGISDRFIHGLIKPHPLFAEYPDRLTALKAKLTDVGKPWEEIAVTGLYEPAIEIYARGCRVFFVGKSSVIETIKTHPAYFQGLILVEI